MRPLTPSRLILLWLACAALLAGAVLLATGVGTRGDAGWAALDAFSFGLRRDRAAAGALAGAGLAMAGVAYQAVLRNPLADPYLLGASGGAALAAYAWTLPPVVLALPAFLIAAGQQVAAFVGAGVAVGIVLVLAAGRGRLEPTRALLVGVVVGVVCGGLFALLVELYREPGGGALSFLFGRVPDPTLLELALLAGVVALSGLGLAAMGGPLATLGLDEFEASAFGVNVNRSRWLAIGLGSLLAATATAVCGPIGFVGLMGPHLGRLVVGPDPRRLLPVAAVAGGLLLCGADALARLGVRGTGTVLPAGVLTNLMGGPFFLLLLYGRRGRVVG